MKVAAVLTIGGSTLLSSSEAIAEISVKSYKEYMITGGDIGKTVESYINGVGRGIWIANYEGKFFCPPPKFVAQGANFRKWLDEAIAKYHDIEDINKTPIELVLLFQIIEVFPCLSSTGIVPAPGHQAGFRLAGRG